MKPFQKRFTVARTKWHNEMANDTPGEKFAFFVCFPRFAVCHKQDCRGGDVKVIFLAQVAFGEGGRVKFYIGKINVYVRVDAFERVDFFITARVVNDGDFRSINLKRPYQVWDDVRGGHQRDVLRTFIFELFEYIGELVWSDLFSPLSTGDFVVLTENATQITPREKDGTASVAEGDTGFFKGVEIILGNA